MGLKEYKSKRKFSNTPEPKGSNKKSLNKPHFVVQKHFASHLHYEEISSVLKMAVKKPLPKNIKPMLAHLVNEPFDRPKWFFEVKWDGYRIIAYINHKNVRLSSRNRIDFSENFKPVANELAKFEIEAVLDGEIVVVDEMGRSRFQLLQQYQQTSDGILIYYIFDLIWFNGYDLRNLPLHQRKYLLTKIFTPKILSNLEHIRISNHIEQYGKDFFKIANQQALEGIMAKDSQSIYENGQRSHSWLKIKTQKRQEVIIGGYTAPRGGRTYLGALIVGVYKDHQLQYVGHVGVPDEKNRIFIKNHLDKLINDHSSFATPPKINAPATWVKPELICEVSFTEWTDDRHLRQPIFIGLREDKSAKEVHRESEQVFPDELLTEEDKQIKIDGHTVKLTHQNKVFWPKSGYTKGDLLEYYQKISNIILPYLKHRPMVLHRHPHGIEEEGFYQKNYPKAPKWIPHKIIRSHHLNRDIHYLLCENSATLIYLANLGCIEMNPWLSRVKTLEYPDFCVIDLDPESINFTSVVKTAQTIHRLLEKIGVESFCKTSGATGLHIYIPLGAKYTYDQSVQFAELIALEANKRLADITSVIRSPSKRQGKVYIDYLQNRFGQTLAAPYSARPTLGALVSTPLHWREVNSRLQPAKFTIKTIQKRLDKQGDLWQNLLKAKGINLGSILKKL